MNEIFNIAYWRRAERLQNFGDYLSEYLSHTLFYPYRAGARAVHIVGSVLDDMFVPEPGGGAEPVVFWGCGVRAPGGLGARREGVDIRSVRGPLSASELGLGELTPMGDPGLLLPALHRLSPIEALQGRSLCIPHFHDKRSDADIRRASGCDAVVRPNIPSSLDAFAQIVDAIGSADFVLTSSLHAAIVAAAYRRPFAFWDSGEIDLPFKWEDFAASVAIPVRFFPTLDGAPEFHEREIVPALRLPSMWESLARSPLMLRPEGLLKVLAYELLSDDGRSPGGAPSDRLAAKVAVFQARRRDQDEVFESILAEASTARTGASALVRAETEAAAARAALTELQAEVAWRTGEMQILASQREALRAERDARGAEAVALTQAGEERRKAQDERIETLQIRMVELAAGVQEAEERAEGLRLARDELEADRNREVARAAELEDLIRTLRADNDSVAQRSGALQDRVRSLVAELHDAQAATDMVRIEHEALKARYVRETAEAARSEAERSQAQARSLAERDAKLAEAEAEASRRTEALARASAETAGMRERLAARTVPVHPPEPAPPPPRAGATSCETM